MTWNYRVISHPSWDMNREKGERVYRIHEVFTDNGKIIGYSAEGVEPYGETKKELITDLSYMAKAFEKPVLHVADLPDASKFGGQKKILAKVQNKEL